MPSRNNASDPLTELKRIERDMDRTIRVMAVLVVLIGVFQAIAAYAHIMVLMGK